MKWLLVLAIVLPFAQQPTKVPNDKGAAKSNRTVEAKHTTHTQKNEQPPIKAAPISTQSLIPTEDKEASIATTNAINKNRIQAPAEDLRIQQELVWFTGALVAVGILQAVVMFLTWRIYRRQAHEMRRQRHEMRRQRHVMLRQWKAMGQQAGLMTGQLEEMKKTGKQTDDQIAALLQAAQAAEKSAIAAEKTAMGIGLSAAAAKASADTLVNSERAWVQVPEVILRQKLSFITPSPNQFQIWLHPYIINNGRTQARITKIVARAHILDKIEGSDSPRPPVLPDVPDYSTMGMSFERNIILSPKQGINWINVPVSVEDLERIKARKVFLYIYGLIDYVDISENERQTRFCKIYWIPYGPSDSMFQEDFVESALIPRTYTECT